MTDTVVLIAVSQLVCIGGLAFLAVQLQRLRRDLDDLHADTAAFGAGADEEHPLPGAFAQHAPLGFEARPADSPAVNALDLAAIARRMQELGVDIPTLARRMQRSEDEVRMLLQGHGGSR